MWQVETMKIRQQVGQDHWQMSLSSSVLGADEPPVPVSERRLAYEADVGADGEKGGNCRHLEGG